MFRSLRSRLSLIFIGLAVIPLVVVSAIITQRNIENLREDALRDQSRLAELAGKDISAFIRERESQLQLVSEIRLTLVDLEAQRGILNGLLAYDRAYQELALLDAQGNELVRLSRTRSYSSAELSSRSNEEAYTVSVTEQTTYFSPVRFDSAIREPLMEIGVPVIDPRTEAVEYVIVAEFRFRPVWDLIGRFELTGEEEEDTIYVTNLAGALVAHRDPSLVLSGREVVLPADDGEATGLDGESVLLVQSPLTFGSQTLNVVVERPVARAYAPVTQDIQAAIGVTVAALIVAAFLVLFTVRRFVRPIERLSVTAQAISHGDLSARATVQGQDEISELARSFNAMATQLSDLINNLEKRVSERTRDLRVAADVSTQVTTILNRDALLQEVVKRVQAGFGFYYTSIFTLEGDRLRLVAGDGKNEQPLETDFAIAVNGSGLIAKAARERKVMVAQNIAESAEYFPHAALPKTASELAIPMIVGSRLVGVLDLQSDQLARFGDDEMQVLPLLAEQIGVALENASLYTEANEAREAAEQANQIKSQFLANMSHELRTPLNAILNFTAFVADGVMGPINDEQTHALQQSIASGKHLLSLINDILDVTKIEAGLMDLFIQEVDMNEILSATVSVAKGLVKDKPIELETEIADTLPTTFGDKRRIRQVLLNLVSNAVKFTPRGKVYLTAAVHGNQIKLMVRDSGIGIPPNQAHLVFETFKQVHHELPESVGTGLGMPISKYFVESHGGRIWFESEVDKGTTFYVELPILTEAEANFRAHPDRTAQREVAP